jgi:hypothetical protein
MSTQQYGPARITTNLDVQIQRIAGLNYPNRVFGKVWTDLEHAIHVEYGTKYMTPRAMIRQSLPAIKAYGEQLWLERTATGLLTPLGLKQWADDVLVMAKEEIEKNTPLGDWEANPPKDSDRKHLQESWQIQEAELS